MDISEFDYFLPKELIAQSPAEPRDSSRLMVLGKDGNIQHSIFSDIESQLAKGDVLVVNDSRVIPARIYGKKPTGGAVEILLVKRRSAKAWECMVKAKNLKQGSKLLLDGDITATVEDRVDGGLFYLSFDAHKPMDEMALEVGHAPLPPYISGFTGDPEKYQTVYSKESGSIAAPTAGLHFTPELLERLEKKGVIIARVTLHVSIGTFLPIKVEDVTKHRMGIESFTITQDTADAINLAVKEGRRIIPVGTTSVRALETASEKGKVEPGTAESGIFIYPGYEFNLPYAGMITNFHLPKSTLILLVSAFAGRENVLAAYEEAKKCRYRFYSFGDAMLIWK